MSLVINYDWYYCGTDRPIYSTNKSLRLSFTKKMFIIYTFLNAGSMLVHRLRRWPDIEPTSGQRPVFAGTSIDHETCTCTP